MLEDRDVKEFIAFVNIMIKNTRIDYIKRINSLNNNIVFVEDIQEVSLSFDNDGFASFFEQYNYNEIEKNMTDEKQSKAIGKLSDKEKEILDLIVIKEIPIKEVAEKFNTSIWNIYKLKDKIIKKIKKELKGEK